MSWAYDVNVNLKTWVMQKIEETIEDALIVFSGIIYTLFIIELIKMVGIIEIKSQSY